jgi:hypothetical protein
MYIDRVPNRNSPPAILLRESYRVGSKVKKRTLANLSALPPSAIEAVERSLKGETLLPADEAFQILRAEPHGHVAAVLGTMKKLGIAGLLSSRDHKERRLSLAMIAARVLQPDSKLATARGLDSDTLSSSLGSALGVERVEVDDLYKAMDWLVRGQTRIEKKLAAKHLEEGELVLWDATAVRFDSQTSELAQFGRPKRGGRSERQLVFGLLTTREGVPVAVEVFPGNTGDPSTVGPVLDRIQERFGLRKMTVVGDRGMLTQTRITDELQPRGLDWITSLRAPTIRKLHEEGPLQLSLFDERDLAEITSPDFPGERLIACRNPLLARERARKREVLVQATEAKLEAVRRATTRKKNPLRGKARIGVRVGKVLGASKVAKHFRYEITAGAFTFERDEAAIAREAALDGIYVIRTSVSTEALGAEEVVQAYKRLSVVEQAFRVSKDFALEVQPIRHRKEDRIRAHIFLCMLAFYVRRHMERALAPMLFVDHDPDGPGTERSSIVAPAVRSSAARRKVGRGCDDDGLPLHAFKTLMNDLATLTKNTVRTAGSEVTFQKFARPTKLQQRALDLLGVPVRP